VTSASSPAGPRTFVRELIDVFVRNQTLDLAAQVAYFTVLALFPFAMFVLTLMGFIPLHGLDRELIAATYRVLPPEVARLVEATLGEIIGKERGWLLVTTLGFGLYTASGAVTILITAFNRAYGVAETRRIWWIKLRALAVTLAAAVAAIVAAAALLVGPEWVRKAWSYFGIGGTFDRLWAWARWPTAAMAMTSMVAFIYRYLPNVHRKRRRILTGSIFTVLTWVIVSFGFRRGVAHWSSSYARVYGALGAVVLLLVWLYLFGLTIIVGGEINAILDRRMPHPSPATPHPSKRGAWRLVPS
jgi:membrane protein